MKRILFFANLLFLFSISSALSQADCNSPINASCGVEITGNNTSGANNFNSYNCAFFSKEGREVVYKYVPTSSGKITVRITSNPPGKQMVASILTACDPNSCIDMSPDNGVTDSVYVTAGNAYFIVIDGADSDDNGLFKFKISCPGGANTSSNCNGAININCGQTVNGTTVGETNKISSYVNCGSGQDESGPDKFYKIVLTSTDNITATLSNLGGNDLDVHILNACSESACVARGDNTATATGLPAGTYYIVVDGFQGAQGSFTLNVSCNSVPLGNCGSPIPVTCGQPITGTTTGKSNNFLEYNCALLDKDAPDVVYEYAALNSGKIKVSLDAVPSGKDMVISVLTACNGSTCLDMSPYNGATDSISVIAGNKYYIVVDGEGTADFGNYTFSISCPTGPSAGGLNCATATSISCGQTVSGTTTGGTNSINSYPNCSNGQVESGPEKVYQLVTTSVGDITAKLTNLTFDLDIHILSACDENACEARGNNTATYTNAPAGTYYIVVDGYQGAQGTFDLTVNCNALISGDCNNPIPITCGTTINGNNKGFPNNLSVYECAVFQKEGPEVIYQYVPTTSGKVTARMLTFTSGKEFVVSIMASCDPQSCFDMSPDNGFTDSIDVVAGNTYYVVVDGPDFNDTGSYSFTLTCPVASPSPINCAGATSISCGQLISGDNTGGANNINFYPCANFAKQGPEKVYEYIPTTSGKITAEFVSVPTGKEMVASIFSACTPSSCFDMGPTNGITDSIFVSAGNTYYIVIDGANADDFGSFTFKVSCPNGPVSGANQGTCSDPIPLTCGQSFNGTTVNGQSNFFTYSCGTQQEFGKEKVHKITITDTSNITATLSNLNGVDLDVHILSACNTSSCEARGDNTATATNLLPGDYYIVVDGFGGDDSQKGTYTLNVSCATVTGGGNAGTCANPIAINCGDTYVGTTVDGQANINTYSCGSQQEFGKEKVHQFTITQTSDVTASLSGLNGVDLDVHILSACNSTSCIARGDNTASAINLAPGTYYVVVDGFGSGQTQQGAYTLKLNCTIPQNTTVGTCASPIPLTCGVSFTGTTTNGQANFNGYSCAPQKEFGREKVHTITITDTSNLTASLSGLNGVDLDIHILSACNTNSCLARGDNSAIATNLLPGTYFIVVDGYGSTASQQGAYTVKVTCTPVTSGGNGGNGTGTCTSPIVLACGTPFNGTTTNGQAVFNNYGCAPQNEFGKEKIHIITINQQSKITATLSGLGNVDLDVHLLRTCDPTDCIDRGNTTAIGDSLQPGTYYVVVDGFGANASQQGAYTLTVNCTPLYNNNPNACNEIFFSEYIEGAGQDKVLEIFNPTPNPILLTTYRVEIYANGSATPTSTINLTGTAPASGTYVLSNTAANPTILSLSDQLSALVNFNGNDAILLYDSSNTLIDIIGVVSQDPGTAGWVGGSISTANQGLVRKASVNSGITSLPTAFNPSTEWIGYPSSDLSHLGTHQATCNICATASISKSICPNGSFVFGGSTLTVPGTYYDTTLTTGGCDSVTTLVLTQTPYNTLTKYDSVCTGDSLFYRGRWISVPGTYKDTLVGVNSCDTIATLYFGTAGSLTPVVSIMANTTSTCDGSPIQFTSSFTNGGNTPTYKWYVNSTLVSTSANFTSTQGQLNNNDTVYCEATSSLSCAVFANAYSNQLLITAGTATFDTIYDTICQNDVYLFNNQNITTAGSHYDTLLNSTGCDSILLLNLHVKPSPLVNAFSDVNNIGLGGTVNFSATGSNADTYLWDFRDSSTSPLFTVSHTFNFPGTYEVILKGTLANGCDKYDTIIINVGPTPGIYEFGNDNDIKVYPNPVSDQLTIDYVGEDGSIDLIEVYDTKGNLVLRSSMQQNVRKTSIDLSRLPTGMYHLKVVGNNVNKHARIQKIR